MTLPIQPFHDYRCNCGKLLFKSPAFIGKIEVKCRRCGRIKLFVQANPVAIQT